MSRCTWPETDNSIWNQPDSDKEKFHRTTTGSQHNKIISAETQPETNTKIIFEENSQLNPNPKKNFFDLRNPIRKQQKLFSSTYNPIKIWIFYTNTTQSKHVKIVSVDIHPESNVKIPSDVKPKTKILLNRNQIFTWKLHRRLKIHENSIISFPSTCNLTRTGNLNQNRTQENIPLNHNLIRTRQICLHRNATLPES